LLGSARPHYRSDASKTRIRSEAGRSPDVEVVQVEQRNVPIFGEWIGTMDGFVNADVRAQVGGLPAPPRLSGGRVRQKGSAALRDRPAPFQAALDQALGQLAQATAQLANAQAVQRRTKLDVNRYTPLAREQVASQ
jgi:multidrug efflux pump subunit AcrA (membrane-fusion protein)